MNRLVTFIKKLIGSRAYYRLREMLIPPEPIRVVEHRRRFFSSFLSNGDLVFDVGANYGNRVNPLISIGARVVAVEPQPKCAQYLRDRFGAAVDVIEKGLADQPGVMTMHVSNEDVLSTFSTDWIDAVKVTNRYERSQWSEQREVEMTTLDALIEQFGAPRFIKIDVEGFEKVVLSGLSQPVEAVSVEYTVPECSEDLLICLSQLHALSANYRYNYAVGEEMRFKLDDWLDHDDMVRLVSEQEFQDTAFGDVYAALPVSRLITT